MAKWQIFYRDKDTRELEMEEVPGPITGLQKNEELRKEGHEPIGLRKSPGRQA